jgi:hypothetical protein
MNGLRKVVLACRETERGLRKILTFVARWSIAVAWGLAVPAIGFLVGAQSAPAADAAQTRPAADSASVDPFNLPRNGQVRIVYASGLQTQDDPGRLPTVGLRIMVGPWSPGPATILAELHPAQVSDGFLDWLFTHPPRNQAVVSLGVTANTRGGTPRRPDGDEARVMVRSLAEHLGQVARSARRSLDPDHATVIYFYSFVVTDETRQPRPVGRGVPRMVFKSEAERLATLGRYRVLFSLDPDQAPQADVGLSLNASGEMFDGEITVDDRAIGSLFKARPRQGSYFVLVLSLRDEGKMSIVTLSKAVANIINVGEKSLPRDESVVLYIKSPTLFTELREPAGEATRSP